MALADAEADSWLDEAAAGGRPASWGAHYAARAEALGALVAGMPDRL